MNLRYNLNRVSRLIRLWPMCVLFHLLVLDNIIIENQTTTRGVVKMKKTEESEGLSGIDLLHSIPRGKPKSGRVWKSVKSRHSENKKEKYRKTTWSDKMKKKAEKKSIQEYERQLKERRAKELEDKRVRQEEKKKRKLENQRKSEIVQRIKNTAKIKRMKKKQLRMIEKR